MKKIIFILSLIFISPLAHASSLGKVLEWKYGACAGTRQADEKDFSANPKMVIWYWKCSAPQPDENQIQTDTRDYEQFLTNQRDKDVQDSNNLKSKLKVSDSEIETLAKIIKDKL